MQLENEPQLRFSRLYAMDGNNSLKRMALRNDHSAADTRVLDDSTYFLSRQFVDQYANEVCGRNGKGPVVKARQRENLLDVQSDLVDDGRRVEGDPTDGLHQDDANTVQESGEPTRSNKIVLDECVDNWKSAAKEESKRMWSIFDESGVFVSACRHGLILWIIDMVKSGEL
jgi:hypothetical protein